MRWWALPPLAVLATLALLVGAASSAYAQAEESTSTVFQGLVGPYQIVVIAIPNPPKQGLLHMRATLSNPATDEPVTDARVLVFAQREESAERGRAMLLNSPASPASYDAQLNLLEEGLWHFTFEVSGALGEARVEFPLEVQRQPRSLAGGLAWVGMAVALSVLVALVWWNMRRVRVHNRAG